LKHTNTHKSEKKKTLAKKKKKVRKSQPLSRVPFLIADSFMPKTKIAREKK
jgi:hypothetical protein